MNRKTMRKTVILVGLAVIALIAACLIVAYFAFGGNLHQVRIPEYVVITRVGDHYSFSIDAEQIIWDRHLPNPPEKELAAYPEISAIRSLDLLVTQEGNTYRFETISTSDDPNFERALRSAGIVLKNTQWTWTEAEVIGARATQKNDGFIVLSLPEFVTIGRGWDGRFTAEVDHETMLAACAFDLPLDPEQHSGYRAIMSLSVGLSETDGGYRLQAQSGLSSIMELLAENRVRITDTQWTWTEAEMAERAGEQPNATDVPSAAAAEATPEAHETHETPAPTEPPSNSTSRTNAIKSLYGFDQTAVRVAIRKAKEQYYGDRFESGTVLRNYFAVGTASTPHANCFRIVYDITSTDGPEYLVADVYDLWSETGYTAGDVELRTYGSRAEAIATTDLRDYTLYTLNGGSLVFPENAGVSPFDENGFVCAHSVTTALTYDELWDIPATNELTLLQLLAYARNEMFARAGHEFDSSGSYYRHFSQYDWYEPSGKVTASELAARWPATASNTSTIKFLESLIKEG